MRKDGSCLQPNLIRRLVEMHDTTKDSLLILQFYSMRKFFWKNAGCHQQMTSVLPSYYVVRLSGAWWDHHFIHFWRRSDLFPSSQRYGRRALVSPRPSARSVLRQVNGWDGEKGQLYLKKDDGMRSSWMPGQITEDNGLLIMHDDEMRRAEFTQFFSAKSEIVNRFFSLKRQRRQTRKLIYRSEVVVRRWTKKRKLGCGRWPTRRGRL